MKRKVKVVLMATLAFGLTAGLSACGETEVVEVQTEELTTDEHPSTDEHPTAENEEHPASESDEHPATAEDEHPATEDEHPSE